MAFEVVSAKPDEDESDRYTQQVRDRLDAAEVMGVSIAGSSGCGKTALIEKLLAPLMADFSCAVIVGDTNTAIDAKILSNTGAPIVQLNADDCCYLTAKMIYKALDKLDLDSIDVLLIENLGMLYYAARNDLGTHRRLSCISVTGGWGIIEKYSSLFKRSSVNLITKADLASYVDFDIPRSVSKLKQLNPDSPVIVTSSKNGDGVDSLFQCIKRHRQKMTSEV